MNTKKILLFIPGYNCENQISRVIGKISPDLCKHIDTVIFVNNRSTDNTESVAIEHFKASCIPNWKVLRNDGNYGLGGSHKVAINFAITNDFDHLIVLHGDDQGSLNDLEGLLQRRIYETVDCLLGARFHKESKLPGYSAFRTFGNKAFNGLFSVSLGTQILDLGAGLNMYKVSIFKNNWYKTLPDDLTFNYCAIMGHIYFKHSTLFFPIVWSEDDQISNVRLFSQAKRVLGLLATYLIGRKAFFDKDHSSVDGTDYPSTIIEQSDSQETSS